MKNLLIQGLLIFLLPVCVSAQRSTSIFFETKQTALSDEAKKQLTALVMAIKPLPIDKISIIGFADTDGSDKLNQELSEQRATIVKAFLIEKGLNNSLISTVGRGKIGADKDKNSSRRVDILVEFMPEKAPITTAKPAVVAPTKPIPNIMALYQTLGTPIQNFKIATNRDTLLRGAKGTAIFIPKNVFEGVPPNATVDFRLKEAYSTADILGDNLNSTSGSQLLQTGGMIYADAQYNGKAVSLKDELLVSFASAESGQSGMQIYSGRRDAQQNGKIDWQLAPNETEETVAYTMGDDDSPFLMRDGKRIAKFAEWVDVSSCGVYFRNSDPKKYARQTELNTTCTTILARTDAKPSLKMKSIEEIHRLIFRDMYSFYNVGTLPELQKQDGRRWDSLLLVREKMYDLTEAGEIRRQQKADSLREEQKKRAIIIAQIVAEQKKRDEDKMKVQKFFPVQSLGWLNCDAMYRTGVDAVSVVTTGIPIIDARFYSILITFPKMRMTSQGYQKDGQVSFDNLPKGVDGYIVGMKTENNQPYLAIQKIKTDNIKVVLDYKPVTPAEIKMAFSELK